MSCKPPTDDTVYVSTKRGDTVELVVELYDLVGAPLSITGWNWLVQLRDANDAVVADFAVAPGDSTVGLSLTSSDTTALLGDYDWDLQATDTGATVETLVTGRLRVKEDVSR
jgi:hypothetical protein